MERNICSQTVAYITQAGSKTGSCQISAEQRRHQGWFTRKQATLEVFSAYDLPSIEALIIYFHADSGYPVRDTWPKAIKAGNYDSWPGLTYINATKYCPSSDETIKGHMVHTRQGVWSTKPKNPSKRGLQELPEIDEPTPGNYYVNELYVQVIEKHIIYTDNTGRFHIRARIGNQYFMVAYQSSNVILVDPFFSRKYKNRLAA